MVSSVDVYKASTTVIVKVKLLSQMELLSVQQQVMNTWQHTCERTRGTLRSMSSVELLVLLGIMREPFRSHNPALCCGNKQCTNLNLLRRKFSIIPSWETENKIAFRLSKFKKKKNALEKFCYINVQHFVEFDNELEHSVFISGSWVPYESW